MAFSDDEPRQLDLDDLVEAAEANPLLRRVDALCEARSWDALVELARRCREAYERGKQLWPIAEHIDYRLALEAPPAHAASVLTPAAGRFAFGPLTEVAASTHTFDELQPHLPSPQVAGVVAAERVLRGEVLTGRPEAHPEVRRCVSVEKTFLCWQTILFRNTVPSSAGESWVFPRRLRPV